MPVVVVPEPAPASRSEAVRPPADTSSDSSPPFDAEVPVLPPLELLWSDEPAVQPKMTLSRPQGLVVVVVVGGAVVVVVVVGAAAGALDWGAGVDAAEPPRPARRWRSGRALAA